MTKLMMIETLHGGMYFTITYVAAFLIAAGIMIYHGLKKGYPRSTWFLILLTGVVFFILGNKMFTYSPREWSEVFTGFNFPVAEKKTVLGGIIGMFAGLFLARALLRFNRGVLDAFAIGLPLAMAISRIGCLFAGCCFGTPTNLPWGVQYDSASWVYQVHLAEGLIHRHDAASLAVHPAQLYLLTGGLIIAFIVWICRKQWKSEGNLFLFSVLCYAVLRFVVEFVRAPETNAFTGGFFGGLKIIQWLLLGVILPGFFILIYRETKAKQISVDFRPVFESDRRQILLLLILSALVFAGRRWFDLMELFTIGLFMIPVYAALFVKLYQRYTIAGYRWVFPALLIGSLSFMAQKSSKMPKEGESLIFTDVGFIGMVGSYYQEVSTVNKTWIPGNCNSFGHYSTSLVNLGTSKQEFWQTGIDVTHNKWTGKYKKFAVGARGFFGAESGDYDTDYPKSTTYGISPYVNFDWQYFGFGTGFILGQTKLPIGTKSLNSFNGGEIITTDYTNVYFMPALSVRLGLSDIIYAEASFPGIFPSTTPNALFKAGIGSGLGKANGTRISVGYCSGLYAQAVFPIKNTVVLEAMYSDNISTGINAKRFLTFGIHYRFKGVTTTVQEDKQKKINPRAAGSTFSKLRDVVVDVDGNIYHTLALGGQVWMKEDLKVSHFRDGSEISGINHGTLEGGIQYNWQVVCDSRNLCPVGWHVPSESEWTSLYLSLGGESGSAEKMAESFSTGSQISQWWSSTTRDSVTARNLYLNTATGVVMFTSEPVKTGLAVKCMRDN